MSAQARDLDLGIPGVEAFIRDDELVIADRRPEGGPEGPIFAALACAGIGVERVRWVASDDCVEARLFLTPRGTPEHGVWWRRDRGPPGALSRLGVPGSIGRGGTR